MKSRIFKRSSLQRVVNSLVSTGGTKARQDYRRTGLILTAAAAIYLTAMEGQLGAQALPKCNGVTATIVGTEGPDRVSGTPGNDVIVTLGGDDIVRGGDGNDIICGGDGRDRLLGERGSDVLFGEKQNDILVGHAGADELFGGSGRDVLRGGRGSDRLEGNSGNDRMLDGGPGLDFFFGGGGIDRCSLFGDPVSERAWRRDELPEGWYTWPPDCELDELFRPVLYEYMDYDDESIDAMDAPVLRLVWHRCEVIDGMLEMELTAVNLSDFVYQGITTNVQWFAGNIVIAESQMTASALFPGSPVTMRAVPVPNVGNHEDLECGWSNYFWF